MKKLDIRFCERNLEEEHSMEVLKHLEENYPDILVIQPEHCLGNCSLCYQGPYCTVNDFLFQKDSPEELRRFLDDLFTRLRQSLKQKQDKNN